ncbi:hypothetical protein CN454_04985 [Bacillus cereus]|uniref:hypothetical protein n=2 Tax=Bacillus TaxID=1386 RepID=UPI000BF5FA0E|nr:MULTISPECIES: hypothetical protein [Bacillus cereus group]PEQ78184.1 hypothetical protein CN482_27360 [Bacillus cereus]PES08217.1 hypothetical protein CN501_27855 [Bacillus cereus]PEX15987.1 hypothetical protein CN454_04985 [Bacillus cereus]PGY80094.1 hypothetical protein COE36_29605 [Bacillus cereus]RFB60605.1 hypothetical protein DZB90_12050 [Bacillus thuringiensis]
MDMQSIIALFTDPRFVVGVLSLLGVIYTVYNTRENVNKTNNLKKELEDQANNLKKELADQTNDITKELGEKNLKALEQRRYIDAICAERVKWINSLRDKFSDFLKNVNLQMIDVYKLKSGNSKVDENKMSERLGEVMYLGNHIFLLLNPTEPICKEIRILQFQIGKCLEKFNGSDSDRQKLNDLVDQLSFFYQVVLKAEWKRVKEENKKGEEIDRETMKKIYKETSENIDVEVYDNLYTKTES